MKYDIDTMLWVLAYSAASRSHWAASPGFAGSSRQPYSPIASGVSPNQPITSSALLAKLRHALPLVGDHGL